jgi:hypothetical protein
MVLAEIRDVWEVIDKVVRHPHGVARQYAMVALVALVKMTFCED